jgi:hypothetical protein
MGMATEAFVLLATELLWNVVVWLPTLVFSLIFIRITLGIRLRDLVGEIEHHQTAAVGAVFFWTALGFSMLISRAVADPPTAAANWMESLFWLVIGILIAMLIFVAGVLFIFGLLARRHQQTITAYIRRELRTEHNLSLSLIMGALFIVPVVVAYHMTV